MHVLQVIALVACSSMLRVQASRSKARQVVSGHPEGGPEPTTSFGAVWHIALRPCIESKAAVRQEQELREETPPSDANMVTDYAREAWELDFELHTLSPKEVDKLAEFGRQWHETFKRGLLSFLNATYENERRTLKEERYNDLLTRLGVDHEFFYIKAKEECQAEIRQKHEDAIQPLQVELVDGCQGSCSKFHDSCEEPEESQCPEGTKCLCLYQQNKTMALKVSAATYITGWLFNTVVFWGHGGYAMPGPMEASVAAAFLFATETIGCQCRPLPCQWSAEADSCIVETQNLDAEIEWDEKFPALSQPTAWGRNPYISKVPFPGFKCEPEDVYNVLGFTTSTPKCTPAPCTHLEYGHSPSQETRIGTVSGKLGKIDRGVYNCWSFVSNQPLPPNVDASMPVYALPQGTRKLVYNELLSEKDPMKREKMGK